MSEATTTSCIEWGKARNRTGYGVARYKGKMWYAHRMEWEKANGPIPEGMCVLHRCDNPICVRADHLFLGTHADNHRDMREKGRDRSPIQRGELNVKAKLAEPDVIMIRRLRAEGWTQKRLADRFGVSKTAIQFIERGINWPHLPQDTPTSGRLRTGPFLGEENGGAKLTSADVTEARRLRAQGWSFRRIADRFGVTASTICRIERGLTWTHLTQPKETSDD